MTKEKSLKTLTPDEKFGTNGQKIGDPNGQQVINRIIWRWLEPLNTTRAEMNVLALVAFKGCELRCFKLLKVAEIGEISLLKL